MSIMDKAGWKKQLVKASQGNSMTVTCISRVPNMRLWRWLRATGQMTEGYSLDAVARCLAGGGGSLK